MVSRQIRLRRDTIDRSASERTLMGSEGECAQFLFLPFSFQA
jgi:hypothetical protein